MSFAAIWQALKSLPTIIKFISWVRSWLITQEKASKQKENEQIKNEVENAKTPEEKQKAIEHVATRWGKQ